MLRPALRLLTVFVIAQGVDAVTLDAHMVVDAPTGTVTSHIFESLFEYTPEGKIVPRLAESFSVSGDGSVRTIYIAFNMLKAPFPDLRVRQALNYAVNKSSIVQHILAGVGRPSDAPISPGIFGYRPIMTYGYDPAKAKKLLAEAGHPNGFKTELYCPSGRYLNDIQVCEAVQAQLREVGVDASVKTIEWAAYLDVTKKGPQESVVPMYMFGWGTVTGDADYGLYALFHSSQWTPAGQHRNFYKNPKVDELLDRGRNVADPTAREAAYREAMEQIMKDAPWLFLHAESQFSAVRKNVKGVVIHPIERVMAQQAWIE